MENDLFSFPTKLVNDPEAFLFYYPKKFPKIKEKYLEIIKKYYNNPDLFRSFCIKESKSLIFLARKFIDFYKNIEDIDDLGKLVEIDQKMNKLSCFNFWIYNYLLCEGPLHQFHAGKIQEIAEKISYSEEVDEREAEIERIKNTLIKTDYLDFYVSNFLRSVRIYEELKKLPDFQEEFNQLENSKSMSYSEVEAIIKSILKKIEIGNYFSLKKEFMPLLKVCNIQKSYLSLYSVIKTGFEYRERSLRYLDDYQILKSELFSIFKKAEEILSLEEYSQMKISYQMLRILAECKDLFGESDTIILPFWFKLLNLIASRLGNSKLSLGQGSSYYSFVWAAPANVKDIIFSVDDSDFDFSTLLS